MPEALHVSVAQVEISSGKSALGESVRICFDLGKSVIHNPPKFMTQARGLRIEPESRIGNLFDCRGNDSGLQLLGPAEILFSRISLASSRLTLSISPLRYFSTRLRSSWPYSSDEISSPGNSRLCRIWTANSARCVCVRDRIDSISGFAEVAILRL
ncbi:hypothetical protein Pr1d_42180 [Bythopirellula goksoeyrii]|uniref:Uncharacterized protein n=1 Tax=Bythopirellula goksoeyrii TaxID=1400387 RepID=A0A5B9QRZ0_9BACT|nr:hypothetical protein Pr1d_42180 [Bythopirellula goksoeyrii]